MSFMASVGVDSLNEWSLQDEMKLLDAIIHCGFGNWGDIALRVPSYCARECEKHYLQRFIKYPSREFKPLLHKMSRQLPLCFNNCKISMKEDLKKESNFAQICEMNQYLKRLLVKENDLYLYRTNCTFKSERNVMNFNEKYRNPLTPPCNGYNRIRGDFIIESDNNAEDLLKVLSELYVDLNHDDDLTHLISELQIALVSSYNLRLAARQFRKRIVKNHGLIDRRKSFTMLQQLDIPFSKKNMKVLIPIMRFMSGPQFDLFVERLKYQNELRSRKNRLINYRTEGIKYINCIDIYENLKNKRHENQTKLLLEESNYTAMTSREVPKRSTPLILYDLPGYNDLTEEEKNLCSTYRIVPETFTTFKKLFISECKKSNGLSLSNARHLVKIDVNKTRKIYDYLLSSKLVWLPDGSQ